MPPRLLIGTTGGSGDGVTGFAPNGIGVSGSGATFGVVGSANSASGVGVMAFAAAGGTSVWGDAPNGGVGVFATVPNGGTAMWGDGNFSSAVGVQGTGGQASTRGSGFGNVGVWGDTGVSGNIGVSGTADDGHALWGANNSSGNATLYDENQYTVTGTPIATFASYHDASTYSSIYRGASGKGDLACTGTKSAVVQSAAVA